MGIRILSSPTYNVSGSGAPGENDPYFSDVYLLLHMNGANAGTTFTDSSSFGRTVNASASGATTSTSISKFNGSSGLFNGTTGYLGTDDAPFSFLTSMAEDFTVEAWIYPTNLSTFRCILQMGDAAINKPEFTFNLDDVSGEPYWALGSQTAKTQTTRNSAYPAPVNTWTHVAATFTASSGAMTCWVGGNLMGTATKPSGTPGTPVGRDLTVGSYADGATYFWVGNMAELRITKGVNRYTAPFTPPIYPFPNF